MTRPLTIDEKDSLLKLIRKEGEFIYNGNLIPQSLIKIGSLFESSILEYKENMVFYNGGCEFPPKPHEFPQSTIIGLYEGKAKMTGLSEFEYIIR